MEYTPEMVEATQKILKRLIAEMQVIGRDELSSPFNIIQIANIMNNVCANFALTVMYSFFEQFGDQIKLTSNLTKENVAPKLIEAINFFTKTGNSVKSVESFAEVKESISAFIKLLKTKCHADAEYLEKNIIYDEEKLTVQYTGDNRIKIENLKGFGLINE